MSPTTTFVSIWSHLDQEYEDQIAALKKVNSKGDDRDNDDKD